MRITIKASKKFVFFFNSLETSLSGFGSWAIWVWKTPTTFTQEIGGAFPISIENFSFFVSMFVYIGQTS